MILDVPLLRTLKSGMSAHKARQVLRGKTLDHGISRLYAPGTATDYLVATSCGPITSCRIVGKRKTPGVTGGFGAGEET